MKLKKHITGGQKYLKKFCVFVLGLFIFFSLTSCGGDRSSGKGGKSSPTKKIIAAAPRRIVTDGKSADWSGIEVLTPDVGSAERGEHPPEINLKSVKVTHDGNNIFFLLQAQHVGSGVVNIFVDSDGNKATGITRSLIGDKMKTVGFEPGWDYIIKLTYSSSFDRTGKGEPYLISQVEKFKKAKYGYSTTLVDKHRNNKDDPVYVGVTKEFQELRIPFDVLEIKPPTAVNLLFVEGHEECDEYGELIGAVIEE